MNQETEILVAFLAGYGCAVITVVIFKMMSYYEKYRGERWK